MRELTYQIENADVPLFVGQQMDAFINASGQRRSLERSAYYFNSRLKRPCRPIIGHVQTKGIRMKEAVTGAQQRPDFPSRGFWSLQDGNDFRKLSTPKAFASRQFNAQRLTLNSFSPFSPRANERKEDEGRIKNQN